VTASEQDPVARAAWRAEVAVLDPTTFVFVDETSTTIALSRRYARAPRGERAVTAVPRNHGTATSLVAALSPAGLGAAMTLEGALDGAAFTVYVRDLLCPTLDPGQVVLLDNVSIHHGEAVREWIEAAGCTLRFLPPYSPDFAPIEHAFAKLKEVLRAAGARTQADLEAAIADALDQVTPADARGWFTHCGYPLQAQAS
jgi:transposase